MNLSYAALITSIILGVIGQLLLKCGAEHAGTISEQFQHPLTLMGFATYVISGTLYVIAIKAIPVSIAFPSVSASYILVGIAGHFFWNEPFGTTQIAGIFLIGGGIILLHQ